MHGAVLRGSQIDEEETILHRSTNIGVSGFSPHLSPSAVAPNVVCVLLGCVARFPPKSHCDQKKAGNEDGTLEVFAVSQSKTPMLVNLWGMFSSLHIQVSGRILGLCVCVCVLGGGSRRLGLGGGLGKCAFYEGVKLMWKNVEIF